jgi:uncharacterized protein
LNARNLIYADAHHLRAPWRIALFILVAVAAYALAIFLSAPLLPPHTFDLVSSYFTLLALLIAHAVALRWIEPSRPWSFVALAPTQANLRDLTTGFLLGALTITLPIVALLLAHDLSIQPTQSGNWWAATGHATLFLLPAAFTEELFLRGYIFAVLRETVGWKATLISTSIVFGLLHLNNPGATAESTMLVILAGFFLGGVLLVTNSLYATWMAHFAWNWTMAAAFHTAVSGLGLSTPTYHTISTGPTWLTGGLWGPEGGFAAGISMFLCILFLSKKQFHINKTMREQ